MANYKRSAQTKELILETASRLFLEKGYNAATVREICSQLKISVSRVNYHFSSKADLAGMICSRFFHNFSQEIKKAIGNPDSYSLVTEAIALRFLIRLMIGDSHDTPTSRFYQEAAREGILAQSFSLVDKGIFTRTMATSNMLEAKLLPEQLEVYARIFASALSAVIQSWEQMLEQYGGDREKSLATLQDIFVGLFMQMLNYRHDAQREILILSDAYYRLMDVEFFDLTNVRIHMSADLTEEDRHRILKLSAKSKDWEQNDQRAR